VERALQRLRTEHAHAGKGRLFAELSAFLPGAEASGTMAEAAGRLGISEGAAKVAVHRIRQRFRQVFREEIAQTMDDPNEVDEEIRHVVEALSY